jgi:hypothetical protein
MSLKTPQFGQLKNNFSRGRIVRNSRTCTDRSTSLAFPKLRRGTVSGCGLYSEPAITIVPFFLFSVVAQPSMLPRRRGVSTGFAFSRSHYSLLTIHCSSRYPHSCTDLHSVSVRISLTQISAKFIFRSRLNREAENFTAQFIRRCGLNSSRAAKLKRKARSLYGEVCRATSRTAGRTTGGIEEVKNLTRQWNGATSLTA